MKLQTWIGMAKACAPQIKSIIDAYHPKSPIKAAPQMTITAPRVEAARLAGIDSMQFTDDPAASFEAALERGDVEAAMLVMSEAWFAVPESTECWNIDGFSDLCDLLDDSPEEQNQKRRTEQNPCPPS